MRRIPFSRRLTRVAMAFALALPASATAALPAIADDCPWMDTSLSPEQRARLLLDASSLDQKMRWLNEQAANNPTQTTFNAGGGQTATYPVQVACAPLIQYTDGPQAVVSGAGPDITAFPAQVALSATWDPALARSKGQAHGSEAFDKQRNVLLAPGLASGRDPRSGRTAEYLGEDPLLAGLMAGAHAAGIQDNPGVEAQLKHFVANEQEIDRNSSSSNVDLQTLHEIYTLPFQIAVEEGDPGSVMCAFNQVNHVYSCENAAILGDILKSEIGFEGWVVTDFGAIHSLNSTPPSLVAGLDQELNRPRFWNPTLLHGALDAGTITETDIDEAAFRVVRAHIEHGLFDVPRLTAPRPRTNEAEHEALARQIAEEGSVLLKNDGLLPLSGTGQTIAVIGPTASSTPTNNISAASVCGTTAPNVPCAPTAPLDSITARAAADGNTVVFDNGADLATAAATAGGADVAIVFGYYRSGEFNDRANILLDGNGNALIAAVAAANANTIVVLQTGGPVLMPWLADVEGVLEVWYAGQEMGPAIASLLWGDVNPSGKLTHSFPVSEADLPTAGSPAQYPGIFTETGTTTPPSPRAGAIRQVEYTEGLYVGYRWYDEEDIDPLFPFGFGLSYTSFEYSNLAIKKTGDGGVNVSFTLTNTGGRTGTEVPQAYLGPSPTAPGSVQQAVNKLAGFKRIELEPGQSQKVQIHITRQSLSYWSTDAEAWVVGTGSRSVSVGSSSRDLPLSANVTIN